MPKVVTRIDTSKPFPEKVAAKYGEDDPITIKGSWIPDGFLLWLPVLKGSQIVLRPLNENGNIQNHPDNGISPEDAIYFYFGITSSSHHEVEKASCKFGLEVLGQLKITDDKSYREQKGICDSDQIYKQFKKDWHGLPRNPEQEAIAVAIGRKLV